MTAVAASVTVVAPSSYEHAHTSTAMFQMHSLESLWKHTVPADGELPTAGCGVLSQPAYCVPHVRPPGGSDGMRQPAAPLK